MSLRLWTKAYKESYNYKRECHIEGEKLDTGTRGKVPEGKIPISKVGICKSANLFESTKSELKWFPAGK